MADDGRPWPLAIVIDSFHFLDLSTSFVTQNCRGTGEGRPRPPASQPRDGRESGRHSQRALGMSADLASTRAHPLLAGRHDDNSPRSITVRTAGEWQAARALHRL